MNRIEDKATRHQALQEHIQALGSRFPVKESYSEGDIDVLRSNLQTHMEARAEDQRAEDEAYRAHEDAKADLELRNRTLQVIEDRLIRAIRFCAEHGNSKEEFGDQ